MTNQTTPTVKLPIDFFKSLRSLSVKETRSKKVKVSSKVKKELTTTFVAAKGIPLSSYESKDFSFKSLCSVILDTNKDFKDFIYNSTVTKIKITVDGMLFELNTGVVVLVQPLKSTTVERQVNNVTLKDKVIRTNNVYTLFTKQRNKLKKIIKIEDIN